MRFHGPFRGLNTRSPAERLGPQWAVALNDVLTRSGAIEKRPGWDRVNAVATFGSLLSDNFNRADAPTLGTGWHTISYGMPEVIDNMTRGFGNTYEGACRSTPIGSANYRVEMNSDVVKPDIQPGWSKHELVLRKTDTSVGQTYYAVAVHYGRLNTGWPIQDQTGMLRLVISRVDGGSYNTLVIQTASVGYPYINPAYLIKGEISTVAGDPFVTGTLIGSLGVAVTATASDADPNKIVGEGYAGFGFTCRHPILGFRARGDDWSQTLLDERLSVNGLFNFKTPALTNYLFVKGGSKLSYLTGGQFKLIANVFTTTSPDWEAAQGKVYMANGGTENAIKIAYTSTAADKIENVTTPYRVGIEAPTAGPSLGAIPGTGALNGTHDYRYTFLNFPHGIESNPSPATTINPIASKINLVRPCRLVLIRRSRTRRFIGAFGSPAASRNSGGGLRLKSMMIRPMMTAPLSIHRRRSFSSITNRRWRASASCAIAAGACSTAE